MLDEKWHVVLLNGLQVRRQGQGVDRFRTQKTGELLAFLALHTHRPLPREEIVGILWPDSDLEAGRASLRTALASLRGQLEPPGSPANSVLVADRVHIRLNPDAVHTDVGEFEAVCRRAESASAPEQRLQGDRQAVQSYAGDLLPGYYAEWVLAERARLAQQYRHHLRRLVSALHGAGQNEAALPYARLLLAAEPYEEETRLLTMRVTAAAGLREEALRGYEAWKRLLRDELHTAPSPAADLLAQQIQQMPVCESLSLPAARVAARPTAPSSHPSELPPPLELPSEFVLPSPAPCSPETVPPVPLPPARLPLPLSRFFGRETEILQVARLLSPALEEWSGGEAGPPSRLVTLTGPGGTGKTRLAIEVARLLHQRARLPVTFVPLADLAEPCRIAEALLRGLGRTPEGSADVFAQVVSILDACPQVLILDNFEQLLSTPGNGEHREPSDGKGSGENPLCDACDGAEVVQALLARIPTLLCLVTSRQCLNLEGEQEYPLLPLPTPTRAGTPERLLEFASVKLFVNRAQLSRPDFQLTSRNAPVVAELCAQLEGLPLALELAAAWISSLSPAQIQQRLAQRFELLVGRRRGRVSRHHSLHEAMEWSYRLLDPQTQHFFACLAVFRGGWTLEAAEQVCDEPNALHYLNALRERSLILFAPQEADEETIGAVEAGNAARGETARYSMLETLREFANVKLGEEQRNRLAERHARWCLARLKQHDFALAEQENYYAAYRWAQAGHEELYFNLLFALSRFWREKGWWQRGLAALQVGLERDGSAHPAGYGNLYRAAARLAWLLKDLDTARRYQDQALTLFTALGDTTAVMDILNGMGCVALDVDDCETAQLHFQQVLELAEQPADLPMMATIHGNLGSVAMQKGDWAAAEAHIQQCLQLHQQCNLSLAWSHQNLGALALAQAQWAGARTYLEQSLAEYRQTGETYRIAEVLEQLAYVLEHCGEPEAARQHREESQLLSLQLRAA